MNINVKKLVDMIGVSGNNASIRGENFSISDGTMVFKNYFISLNAIATVEVKAQAKQPLIGQIILTAFGVLSMIVQIELIQLMGVVLFVIGLVALILTIDNNNKLSNFMIVTLLNGQRYIYRYQDKDFCERVYEVIRICINNRGASYNFMVDDKKIVNNIDNSDRSIGKITNSTIGDDNTINIGGNTGIQAGGDVIGQVKVENTGLTLDEWKSLESFFINERNVFQDDSEVREICEQILEHIKKKDEKSLKSFLKTCSRGALKAIVGSKAVDGFNVAMSILKKLVK